MEGGAGQEEQAKPPRPHHACGTTPELGKSRAWFAWEQEPAEGAVIALCQLVSAGMWAVREAAPEFPHKPALGVGGACRPLSWPSFSKPGLRRPWPVSSKAQSVSHFLEENGAKYDSHLGMAGGMGSPHEVIFNQVLCRHVHTKTTEQRRGNRGSHTQARTLIAPRALTLTPEIH